MTDDVPPDPVRRFIAGAVCPSCGEMDKIVAWNEGGALHRECVRCGFRDRMREDAPVAPPTRVDPDRVQEKSETVQPIRFFKRAPPTPKKDNT